MEDKVNVSAQKTVKFKQKETLEFLVHKIGVQEKVEFKKTNNSNLYCAKFKDNSKLYVASFTSDKGKTIAMIDNKNVDKTKREERQLYWKKTLNNLFYKDI